MRRDILNIKLGKDATDCCPGHSTWPDDTYRNRRSKAARSRDIKKEHRMFRRVTRQATVQDLLKED